MFDPLAPNLMTASGNWNVLNYRQPADNSIPLYTSYVNNKTYKTLYGIPDDYTYESCNNDMYTNFWDDITMSFASDVAYLIKNTRVLLYNGQDDFLINSMGTERWIQSMNTPEVSSWIKAPKQTWVREVD